MSQIQLAIVTLGRPLGYDEFCKDLATMIDEGSRDIVTQVHIKSNMAINQYRDGKWYQIVMDIRSFDTVYLPHKLAADIKQEFNNFAALKSLYDQAHVPYRKGFLFYGPPGTGKTSLVKALAYEHQIQVYVINVNDSKINDVTIVDLLNSMASTQTKIVLFEDIDTAFADKEKMAVEEKSREVVEKACEGYPGKGPMDDNLDVTKGPYHQQAAKVTLSREFLTYSGLLNALDGAMSNQTGVITIMTTNNEWKLGKALIRPGRIDCKFYLGPCNHEQIRDMTVSILKRARILADKSADIEAPLSLEMMEKVEAFVGRLTVDGQSTISPCTLQGYLLQHIEKMDMFEAYRELL